MIIITTDTITGKEIKEVLGLVDGSTTRARNIGSDVLAGFKSIVGGEVIGYTKLLADTRQQALDRLEANAKTMGADAIIGLRFTTSSIANGISEILAYGTAVKLG